MNVAFLPSVCFLSDYTLPPERKFKHSSSHSPVVCSFRNAVSMYTSIFMKFVFNKFIKIHDLFVLLISDSSCFLTDVLRLCKCWAKCISTHHIIQHSVQSGGKSLKPIIIGFFPPSVYILLWNSPVFLVVCVSVCVFIGAVIWEGSRGVLFKRESSWGDEGERKSGRGKSVHTSINTLNR